jgi:hypothetical protein
VAPGPYQAGPDERATTKSVPSPREGCAFPEISHPRVPRQANTKSSRPPSAPTTISKPHRCATPKAPPTASRNGFSGRCCRFGTKIGPLGRILGLRPIPLPDFSRESRLDTQCRFVPTQSPLCCQRATCQAARVIVELIMGLLQAGDLPRPSAYSPVPSRVCGYRLSELC